MLAHAGVPASLQFSGLVLTPAGLFCCSVIKMSQLPAVCAQAQVQDLLYTQAMMLCVCSRSLDITC